MNHATLKNSPNRIIDTAFTLFSFMCLFLILTNAIPLMQLGIFEVTVKKGFFMKVMRASIAVFFAATVLLKITYPNFLQLTAVRWFNHLISKPPVLIAGVFFVIYAATFIAFGFYKHLVIQTRAFDLGIFAQAVWTTLHGEFLFSSIKDDICLLGDHVSPILAALTPFYAIWPDPRTLLIIQALTAAACFFPLAAIARTHLKEPFLMFVFLAAYFFFLPARAALREDFHPEVMVDVIIFCAFLCFEQKKYPLFILLLAVIASAKENMLGVTFIFGFYALLRQKILLGTLVMMFSAAIFAFEIKWIVPFFSGKAYFYQDNYSQLIRHGFNGEALLDRLEYILKLFGPFLFLPFLHPPTLLLTIPILFQNLLSQNPLMLSFGFHYLCGLSPFVFISAIFGFNKLFELFPQLLKLKKWAAALILMIVMLRGAPSEYFFIWRAAYDYNPHLAMVREKLAGIPSQYSVLTHNSFIPQTVNRMKVYQFDLTDHVSKIQMAHKLSVDYVVFDRAFWEGAAIESVLPQFLSSGYEVHFETNGFYMLRKSDLNYDQTA